MMMRRKKKKRCLPSGAHFTLILEEEGEERRGGGGEERRGRGKRRSISRWVITSYYMYIIFQHLANTDDMNFLLGRASPRCDTQMIRVTEVAPPHSSIRGGKQNPRTF